MILTDRELDIEIRDGNVVFDTPDGWPAFDRVLQVRPSSVDLRLDKNVRIPKALPNVIIRADTAPLASDYYGDPHELPPGGYNLEPGEFILGQTLECITVPLHLAATIDGMSRWARLGLYIHATSAHVDPGFHGTLVLEILNAGKNRIALVPAMPICQLIFHRVSILPKQAYKGRFAGQMLP